MADQIENPDADGQDLAEVFDETNITPDGEDIATPDQQRDVFDATTALDDADEDDTRAAEDDFDPDEVDESELDEIMASGEDLDEPRSFSGYDADRVQDGALQPADLESSNLSDEDLEEIGYDPDAASPT